MNDAAGSSETLVSTHEPRVVRTHKTIIGELLGAISLKSYSYEAIGAAILLLSLYFNRLPLIHFVGGVRSKNSFRSNP